MTDWTPLRDHLRQKAEVWIDSIIASDPDRLVRAWLAAHRERVLERMVDQAELITMRRILVEREAAADRVVS